MAFNESLYPIILQLHVISYFNGKVTSDKENSIMLTPVA